MRPWAVLMQFTMWLADNFLMFKSCPVQSVPHVLNKSLSCLCPPPPKTTVSSDNLENSIFLPAGLSVHLCHTIAHLHVTHSYPTTLWPWQLLSVKQLPPLYCSDQPGHQTQTIAPKSVITKVAQVGKSQHPRGTPPPPAVWDFEVFHSNKTMPLKWLLRFWFWMSETLGATKP